MATAAASLDRCSVPGRGHQESLPADQLEFGMGIHNEPGVCREPVADLATTVDKALDMLFAPKPNMWQPGAGERVALMVNNLGGLSVLELGVVADEVARQLEKHVVIDRSLVGTFVTSLDGPGFSVTLMKLDDELVGLLDAPTTAPAWPRSIHGWKTTAEAVAKREVEVPASEPNQVETGVRGKFERERQQNDANPRKFRPSSSRPSSTQRKRRRRATSPRLQPTTPSRATGTAERRY